VSGSHPSEYKNVHGPPLTGKSARRGSVWSISDRKRLPNGTSNFGLRDRVSRSLTSTSTLPLPMARAADFRLGYSPDTLKWNTLIRESDSPPSLISPHSPTSATPTSGFLPVYPRPSLTISHLVAPKYETTRGHGRCLPRHMTRRFRGTFGVAARQLEVRSYPQSLLTENKVCRMS
jgi:hypothetical protein